MYTASASSSSIGVYDLTTGSFKGSAGPFDNGNIASLNTNSAGTVLYEAEYNKATILGLAPNSARAPLANGFVHHYTGGYLARC